MTLTVLAIDPPKWTEVDGFWVALVTAAATIATVLVALWIAGHGNTVAGKRLEEEREAADRRLAEQTASSRRQLEEERAIAEQRIQAERAFATTERLHERQTAAAAVLLDRVAHLTPYLPVISNLDTRLKLAGNPAMQAVEDLRRGALVEALMLGNPELTLRYRRLVHLVYSAAGDTKDENEHRTAGDLRNYAKFVRLSLKALVDGEALPDPGARAYPYLNRGALETTPWHPTNIPAGWDQESYLDPRDVQFRTQSLEMD